MKLIMPLMRLICSFLILGAHTNLMVPSTQVQFGEVACAGQFAEKFVDYQHGKFVFDSQIIEATVIDANIHEPSFFCTNKTGEANGLMLGMMMMPSANI